MKLKNFDLLSKNKFIVDSNFGWLGSASTLIGLWYSNLVLGIIGGIILGVHVSQIFPVWKEADPRFNDGATLSRLFQPAINLLWFGLVFFAFVFSVYQLLMGDIKL